jgi:hypothetical protein
VPAAYARSTWVASITRITYITDKEFDIFPVVVEPSGAIPQDKIETDDDACSVNEVTKVKVVIIFEESAAFQPSFIF